MAPKSIDDLIAYDADNPSADHDDLIYLISNLNVESENDLDNLKKGFMKMKQILLNRSRESEQLLQEFEKLTKREVQYKEEIQSLQKELRFHKSDADMGYDLNDPKSLQTELMRSENRNEELRNEINDYIAKSFQEKTEKDKLSAENDDLKKQLNKLRKDNLRIEEENREFARQIQHFRDERYSRTGEESGQYKEKINQKNKIINELENDNMRLEEENQRLNEFVERNKREIENSTEEMNKTRMEITRLKNYRELADMQLDEMRRENEILKSQIDVLNLQVMGQKDQDAAILSEVDSRVEQYKIIIKNYEEKIRSLNDIVIHLKDDLSRQQMDSDKVSVTNLTKAIQDKDKQIEILKKQSEVFAQEMDKSRSVINNLNRALYDNTKMASKDSQYIINKQAEQKIAFLESMLKESEERFRSSEQHASEKEKELAQVLQRLNEYESGDYQLQQAVNEIKGLKNQIKIRDRDIETLTKHLNKLDDTLGLVLEENEDLRAKLGMDPRDKLDLGVEELNKLRAIRAQENRSVVHVLKREIETLEEERNKLKMTIRKLAKQLGSKVNVASILDDGLDYYDIFLESKGDKKDKQSKLNAAGGGDSKLSNDKNAEVMRRRNENLMQLIQESENENKLLEKGLIEIHDQLVKMNPIKGGASSKRGGKQQLNETIIKCPTLDKLLSIMETNRASRANSKTYAFLNQILADGSADAVTMALKSEIDYLNGRNEELRAQLIEQRAELSKTLASFNRAQDEIDRLNGDVRIMNQSSSAKDIFQPLKLPAGMAPSSQDIISALNEYLLDTLQELEEYKKVTSMSEKDLEMLRRKYAVARHQISLLYRDHLEENKQWKQEKETLLNEISKLGGAIEVDAVKLQEYERLLDTLEKDEQEVVRRMAENSRKMCAIRASEKQLQRKCSALEEVDQNLLKENKKLKIESIEMEIAVQQRIGYLERYKDMANFKIVSLHKQLEESVPFVKLEFVNKQYNDVVQNYRQLLDKHERAESLTQSLHQTEELNKKYESEINFLRRELENEKDKSHMLEESLNRLKNYGGNAASAANNPYGFSAHYLNGATAAAAAATAAAATAASGDAGIAGNGGDTSSMLTMAKRLTAIEMKELNERQRADHAQRMYDEQRNVLRQLENRNLELEANYAQLSKLYLNLQKTEQTLREELAQSVSKSVNDSDKSRIAELEKQEHLLKLDVSRLRELTEIALYQTASLEFINNISKAQTESFGLIDVQSLTKESSDLGKLHRQIILLQISEATAVRKLQQSQNRCKKLEAQLIRAEQKYDRESMDFFNNRKEYISKITYLRSTVHDLRHKYTGSIPLKQQEKFNESKERVAELKKELTKKLTEITTEKHDLEDKIAEYEMRAKSIEMLKNAAVVGADGTVKFNEKFLDSFKKSENLKMLNLKLERANRRYKDEIKFLEELNRKYEITIINLEEENLRLENEFDQKMLVWEHREADLERTVDHLRKQHQMIENLAISFEEISGNMPDPSMPIANQLDQAMNIIRSHVKLLAEAKIQSDLSRKKIDELEQKVRSFEHEINIRDKAIAELRLRLPATLDRDVLVGSTMNVAGGASGIETSTSVRAAQSTIESLQNRLKQKDDSIAKYQDLLRLAREEITKINKQHELEINNMIDQLNLTRDTNIQKLKQELRNNAGGSNQITTRAQLSRLQELEEVTVEQENTISALNQKVKKLTTEVDTWKARFEMQSQNFQKDLANAQREQVAVIERLNSQLIEYRTKVSDQDKEMSTAVNDLDNNNKKPAASAANKSIVEQLKQQLAEKEEKQKALNQALIDIRTDMMNMARITMQDGGQQKSQDEKMKSIIESKIAEYQDKLCSVGEELAKTKKELKTKMKQNDELNLELEHVKAQMRTKDQKIKKLVDENQKLAEDGKQLSSNKMAQNLSLSSKSNDVDYLKRQIRTLEEKLRHKMSPAEKPFEQQQQQQRPISKSPNRSSTSRSPSKTTAANVTVTKPRTDSVYALKSEIEQWKTRYNYVLSENAVIMRERNDLQVELARMNREIEQNASKLAGENRMLRDEIERLRSGGGKGATAGKTSFNTLSSGRDHMSNEIQRLKKENDRLKDRTLKLDEMQKLIDHLKSENERLRLNNNNNNNNDDARSDVSSSSTSSNLRKIGESGRSTVELEKTIYLMKKLIVKQQKEIDSLKKGGGGGPK